MNAISTLVVARVGTPRRAGVVLGIGIARARVQAPPARHSTGYHSTDDAHAPLCMSNSLHAAHSTQASPQYWAGCNTTSTHR